MNRIDVLLADDHEMIRNGLRNILGDTEDLHVAGEASNGNAVLEMVRENDYRLAILDMSMPGRNGLELIKLLKAERPRLPLLVFTMHQEEQYAVRAMRAGAAGYLTKECDGDVLLAAARKVAAGGVYVSPKVADLLAADLSRPQQAMPHTWLSNREFEVFDRIVRGMSLTAIADELSLSIKTVSTHKSHIMDKMDIANQADLVRYAIDHGLSEHRPG
jgi:DNA-binding NarL/FixJ family response regulator